MSKSILFICQSCNAVGHDIKADSPADGSLLFKALQELQQKWSRRSELDIQPVECLWTCDHPCAVALSNHRKSTYMLAKVPVDSASVHQTAEALLHLSEYYIDSKDGTVPWKKFPVVLQTEIIARIPPAYSSTDPEQP